MDINMSKEKICLLYFLILLLTSTSCNIVDSKTTPDTSSTTKNVRFVANMVSSSGYPNPSITYTNQSGGTTQIQAMNLDVTQAITVNSTTTLTAACDGNFSPSTLNSSAAIELKIYVNDSLKANANDLKTDPQNKVSASATCSYKIK
jgi:hypothetical protein